MIKLSTIIVSYNTKDLLKECLSSVVAAIENLEAEIIVVDNDSTDGTVEMLEGQVQNEIKILRNKENLGFARANNIGIQNSSGKYILLLNSDTIVEKNTIAEMVKYMEQNPKIGVATCRVELPDNSLDPACHRGFPTPWASMTYFLGLERLFPMSKIFGQYHLGFLPMGEPHEIDSPSGAFYLVRREVIDRVGMLDEDYFMYGEDLDWSFRIKQAGWKIMYYPFVKITHFKKRSGRAGVDVKTRKETTKYFYETMKIFYQKHYANKYPAIINSLFMLAIDAKKKLNSII